MGPKTNSNYNNIINFIFLFPLIIGFQVRFK